MPVTVVPVRSKTSVSAGATESEHMNTDGNRRRCASTMESFKILRSLMHTFIVIGNMGWKDFSKAGCLVHLTKSTVYGIIVIIFLSTNVIRWCMAVNGDDTFGVMLIYKLMNMTWGLETLGHCIGFFIASLSYKRLPEFLAEWDKLRLQCVNNATSLKKQTDICTAVTWLLAGLNIAFCIYLTFGTHVQDLMLYPLSIDDDPSTILAMKIINVVVQSYLILAWITPSALLFMVAKFLAWEFSHSTAKIRELRDKCNTTCLERIRKHHQKLCNLVDHADDIFSMQIAATFLGSLMLICLILYVLIHDETNDILTRCIQIYWLTTAVCKILIDCISGARLNNAVSTETIPY